MTKRIYLDNNSTTFLDPQVMKVLVKDLEEEEGNPSSTHFHGQACRRKLEQCRQSIANYFKLKPTEIIFTSGGTEGAALLLHGIMLQHPFGHMISSLAEHACVSQTLKEFEKRGAKATYLSTGTRGAVLPEDVERAIQPDTRLIALMAVNNETGVMTDLVPIADIAQRHNIPLIVDGVAWLGKEAMRIPSGVSALFFSGHKIHAPKGIGFCICRQNLRLTPLFVGGGQEHNRRAGTENLPGIVALSEAVALLEPGQESMTTHMRRLRDLFEQRLLAELTEVEVNGLGPRICNTTNLAFLGVDGETLLMNLDQHGISASHGSACSSGALEPSRVLLEMGIPLAQASSSIRFSVSRMTTEDEINTAVGIIVEEVTRLRK